jgi:hypothetical protein
MGSRSYGIVVLIARYSGGMRADYIDSKYLPNEVISKLHSHTVARPCEGLSVLECYAAHASYSHSLHGVNLELLPRLLNK